MVLTGLDGTLRSRVTWMQGLFELRVKLWMNEKLPAELQPIVAITAVEYASTHLRMICACRSQAIFERLYDGDTALYDTVD